MKITHPVILASESPRRKEILVNTGFNVKTVPPAINEETLNKELSSAFLAPELIAQTLASAKAVSVSKDFPGKIIIGADTIVVIDNQILGKPKNMEEASLFLHQLSGKTHQVITGFCIVYDHERISGFEISKIMVKPLTEDDIREYIQIENVLDAAGAYKIQGFFSLYVEKIEGCWNNIVGLPVSRIYDEIKKLHREPK